MATTTTMHRRLIRTKEAATYLSMSEWKLRRLIQDGTVPFVQDHEGSPFLLDLRDLDAYIEGNKHGGSDEVFERLKPVATSRDETRNQIRRLG